MDSKQRKIFRQYLDLLFRWDKFILAVLLVSLVAGLGDYLKTPKVYQSSALIMFEEQKIKPDRAPRRRAKKIEQMVSTVSQQVTSRTSLEKIIKKFGLYQAELARLPLEDVVELMRSRDIMIRATGKKGGEVFRVSYRSGDPHKAMLVTNAIASRFIEENLRFREERAVETAAYIKDELRLAKEALDKKEAAMRDYKLKYYNEMPDQRPVNMSRLNALQQQYQAVQANIQSLEQTRLLVLQQQELQKKERSGDSATAGEEETLAQARQKLKKLLAKYTPEHPAVKRLAKVIAQLEQEKELPAGAAGGDQLSGRPTKDGQAAENLSLQLKEIALNLTGLRQQSRKILEAIKVYQQWIENTPIREAEWAGITRDYDELRKHYEQLVAQSLAAESAEAIERRQKGSQFKVVDPAYLPEKPLKPRFGRTMAAALAIGLGLGGGVVVLLGFFDTSFRDPGDIEEVLGVPVLCALPRVLTDREQRRRRLVALGCYSALAVGFAGLLVVMTYLWRQGVIVA